MVTPYIAFSGNCSAALEFYKNAFNSTVKIAQPYGDYVPEGVTAPPVPNAQEAQKIYDVLSKDAYITLPPTETFYSTFHAGLVDMFGVSWNITALEQPKQS